MPLYDYECPRCGHTSVEFMKMCSAAEADPVRCGHCAKYGHTEMVRQVSQPHAPQLGYHTPILMQSIGCNSVDEIRQMQRAGISVNDDPNHPDYGVPVAHNRTEKLRALKVAGYQEK